MNFATPFQFNSFTFPAWAETTIRHTLQAAARSQVILQAFHKSFTPQLLTTFKDLSHYSIQCEMGAESSAMAAAGITHNPIQAAVHATHAELTSPEAQATYRRLRHIIRESVMDGLIIGLCGVVAVSVGFDLPRLATVPQHSFIE